MVTRTITRWFMSIGLAVFTRITINSLVTTAPAQGTRAATLINCSGPIQACIDAASDGDTILIAAGRYTESLTLSKAVSLTGVSSDTTIIQAVAGQRVLTVTGATIGNAVVISGLTFTGGNADQGGGIYSDAPLIVMSSRFVSNTASGNGGGLQVGQWNSPCSLSITGSTFFNNSAQSGGGLFAYGVVTLTQVDFLSNTAQFGCGGACIGGESNINESRFVNNHALAINSDSGGLGAADGPTMISGTEFISNSASIGGGLYANYTATLYNTRFEGNTATTYGGGLFAEHTHIISGAEFINNTAANGGGAMIGEMQFLSNTLFVGNTASQNGGGLWAGWATSIVNVLFARNSAELDGAALKLGAKSPAWISHMTITSPTIANAAAISFDSFNNASLSIANTIITSHTIAISSTGGMVNEDYNIFFNNITNTAGSIASGGYSQLANPNFVDPTHDDYHLRFGSPAIDHGVDAGINTDLDGKPRPIGLGFDIGAYEYQGGHYLWLPLIRS